MDALSSDDALRQAQLQLVGHAHEGHSPVDTLNRLLTKHFNTRFSEEPRSAPVLTEEHIMARLEWWSTEGLDALWRGHQRATPGGPLQGSMILELPVVVLRLGELDCLIDGNNRVNRRIVEGAAEPHPVYLLELREVT